MSKGLQRNIETARRRILHSGGRGLGYWAAIDAHKRIGNAVAPDVRHQHKHNEEHRPKKDDTIEVLPTTYDVTVGDYSCGLSPLAHHAKAHYDKVCEHSPMGVQMFSIINGKKTLMLSHPTRGFRLEHRARYKV